MSTHDVNESRLIGIMGAARSGCVCVGGGVMGEQTSLVKVGETEVARDPYAFCLRLCVMGMFDGFIIILC